VIVTWEAFPYGVKCANCRRVIGYGESYKNRDAATGKLSTGPYIEDRTDATFCERCL
jgi:hypothetical protein